jgi:hypothetical protein
MSDSMIEVAVFTNRIEADLAKALLDEAGIPAYVTAGDGSGVAASHLQLNFSAQLYVATARADDARIVLAATPPEPKAWLEEYAGQTTDELIALMDEFRADSVVLAFEEALGRKAAGDLSDEERVILAVEALEREVNNGGYGQFFENSSSEYVPIAVDALERIGCKEVAALTQVAIDALKLPGPLTQEATQRVMRYGSVERSNELSECDDRYYELADDLAGQLLEFIKANRGNITL